MLVAMPLVFVGPGVALMESFGLMKDSLLGILIISVTVHHGCYGSDRD